MIEFETPYSFWRKKPRHGKGEKGLSIDLGQSKGAKGRGSGFKVEWELAQRKKVTE